MRTFLQWCSGTYLVLLTVALGVATRVPSLDFGDEMGWQTGHLKSGDFIMIWLVVSFIGALVIFARTRPSTARHASVERPGTTASPH